MALLTSSQLVERLRAGHKVDNLETDEYGQVIVKTGVYRWRDGSYHDDIEVIEITEDESELAHTD
jgi:hypothetical protein